MSSYASYTGAIRVRPKISQEQTDRLNRFFSIRHMRRNVSDLCTLYPVDQDPNARRSHTLWGDGDFGVEGGWYLPDNTPELVSGPDPQNLDPNAWEGIHTHMDMNVAPAGIPSMYVDLLCIPSNKDDCSYLKWNGSETDHEMTKCLRMLQTKLIALGHTLDGTMIMDDSLRNYRIDVSPDGTTEETDLTVYGTYDMEAAEAQEAYETSPGIF